ncbi:ADOP family duplicated permease [Rhodanobacter sp. Col0626]|uniref:ADOP family duplicated permease n=1 Tax=Rhodanobacter sp. Col0626 TaxID=3415679 RepID=UPI003CF786A2
MILRECRTAWRRLLARPGYAVLSATVLGVGLGVVLFLFSVVNTLILQPLPFPQADRLVAIGQVSDNGHGIGDIDSAQYLQLQGHMRSVDAIGAYRDGGVNLDQGHGASYRNSTSLTASMMDLLGVKPLLGRGFVAADDSPGAAPVLLLGETLWRHDFQADPDVVGRTVRINGEWFTVVGVLPADFGFPQSSVLWTPLRLNPGQHRMLSGVARLAPGVDLPQARAELATRADDLRRALPAEWRMRDMTIKPLALSFLPEDTRNWVWLMLGAAGLVLLLACVNVANLQLVQTLNRRRELALRSALGCSRGRLMTGVLIESLLLSMGALALAWPIMLGANRWMVAMFVAAGDPPNLLFRFGAQGWVWPFALGVAVLSTAVAGLIPAWRASRADMQDALRDGGKGSGSGFGKVAKTLVVAQVVLTVVLLVGAGMFVRALGGLLAEQPVGATHAEQVITASLALPAVQFPDPAQRIRLIENVVERLRREPGVIAASASNTIPSAVLGSHEDVSLPGQPQPSDGWPRAQMGIVDAHFLDTYGVRLREGRFFDGRDQAGTQKVVVIDAKMASAFWPHGDALGQPLILYPGKPYAWTVTVIGVIESLQLDTAMEKSLPGLLMPLPQSGGQAPQRAMGLAVRTHADAQSWAPHLMEVVRAVEPQVALYGVASQKQVMAMSRVKLALLTDIFSALGLIALLLAAAGLYGVLAYAVAQRTREIGIRRAIGAGHGAIVREVSRQLAWQLGLGLLAGLALALPWSGLLADPGLHTRAHDPAVFVPVLLLVVGVSVLASLVPLYRALRVDPAIALRYE